jgi:putative phosphoesterase
LIPLLNRIGAIGDVHAEDQALAAALEFFEQQAVDRILCVGDLADGPGDLGRCCQLLRGHAVDVVRGNHDRWVLTDTMRELPDASPPPDAETRAYLESLPTTRDYQTAHGAVLLCHGLGDDDMSGVGPDDFGYGLEANQPLQELLAARRYRFVINGHTHKPMARCFGDITIINVGTLFRDHQPSIAVIDFDALQVTFHQLEGASVGGRTAAHSLAPVPS